MIITPPLLALLWADGQFTTDTNASDTWLGCVLLQEQHDKVLMAIGYWSRSVCDADRQCGTTHKERLAVVLAISMLRLYPEGSHFIMRTDHQTLRRILDLKGFMGRLSLWRLRFTEFDIAIVRQLEKYRKTANTMSGMPQKAMGGTKKSADDDDDIPSYCIARWKTKPEKVSTEAEDDERPLSISKQQMEAQTNDMLRRNLKKVVRTDGTTIVNEDGLLCRKSPTIEKLQIVVPERYKRTLVCHGRWPTPARHPGTRNMNDVLRRTNYWTHIASDLHEFMFKCESCRQHRSAQMHQRWL